MRQVGTVLLTERQHPYLPNAPTWLITRPDRGQRQTAVS
jgi:hypothetical protein